jgi:hypothetical protein
MVRVRDASHLCVANSSIVHLFLTAVSFRSEGVIVNYAGLFDICWMAAPDETSFMSTFLFWVAIVALGAFVLLAALRALGDGAWRVQRPVAFAAAFWFAWWFGTFMVIQAVSAGLGDTTCHRRQRHNAVSGHFGFFIFWNLSALWLLRLVVGEPSTANYLGPALWWRAFKRPGAAHVLAITVAVLCTCSTLTLLRTWFLGYHSMRQCVLGSFVAVTSHYLCANSLDHLFFAPSEERWQWASVWSLRTVLAHALFAAVFEWLVTRRSSLGLGEASMMVLSGILCVALVSSTARPRPAAAAEAKKTE